MTGMAIPPFGRLLTAMVTPFTPDGSIDLDAAARLASYLVDDLAHDGLVISGTGGESPTTSDREKSDLLRVVLDAVGDRAQVLAGVGTFNTEHTLELAAEAAKLGAARTAGGHPLLLPAARRPGLLEHFRVVADATDVPVMLYDIPGRTGMAIATETLLRLAEHPRIVAVKDAKGDLAASARVMAETDLAYYSGDDAATLPLLSVGAVGIVGTSTHFSALGTKAMIEAYAAGDVAGALAWHRRLLPDLHRDLRHPGLHPGQGRAGASGPRRRRRTVTADRGDRGRDRRAAGGPRCRRTGELRTERASRVPRWTR